MYTNRRNHKRGYHNQQYQDSENDNDNDNEYNYGRHHQRNVRQAREQLRQEQVELNRQKQIEESRRQKELKELKRQEEIQNQQAVVRVQELLLEDVKNKDIMKKQLTKIHDLDKKVVDLNEKISQISNKPPLISKESLNRMTTEELYKLNEDYAKKIGEIVDIISERRLCVVCQDKNSHVIFQPCNHVICCETCAVRVAHCPKCRKHIHRKERVYF